jgi:hypothetical protein
MVIITVPHIEYSSEVTDPFYLRCQVDLYCRELSVLENLSQAIGGYIELPYIPHLGRTLTQEECWVAHRWFRSLRRWCEVGGHSSFRIEGCRLNPTITCPLCYSQFDYEWALQNHPVTFGAALNTFIRARGYIPAFRTRPRRVPRRRSYHRWAVNP